MGGMEQEPPMADASAAPAPMDPAQNGNGGMNGGPMGEDPNMGGAPMDNGQEGGAPMDDPNMGGDPSMEGAPMGGDEPSADNSVTKDIDDLKSSLNSDHLEAWVKYGKSMADEESAESDNGGMEGPDEMNGGAPMMEAFIMTKKQLDYLNENFGIRDLSNDDESRKQRLQKKASKKVSKHNPFNKTF